MRSPEKLGALGSRIEVVRGELSDPAAVQALVEGTEAVISLVGPPRKHDSAQTRKAASCGLRLPRRRSRSRTGGESQVRSQVAAHHSVDAVCKHPAARVDRYERPLRADRGIFRALFAHHRWRPQHAARRLGQQRYRRPPPPRPLRVRYAACLLLSPEDRRSSASEPRCS